MRRHLSRLRPLLIGSFARLAAALIGLAGTTVAARTLGPAAWGDWVVLFALFGWSQHLAEWGLRNVALVEGGRLGAASPGLILDLWRARLPVLALAAAMLTTTIWLVRPGDVASSVWFAAALVVIALNLDWTSLVRGDPVPAAAALVMRPAGFLLVVLLLPSPLSVAELAAATAAGWTAAALAGLSGRPWRRTPATTRRRLRVARLLRAGVPFFLVTAANQLAPTADLLAAVWMLGPAAAGTLGLIATVAQAATFGAQASAQWWLARSPRLPPGAIRRAVIEAGALGLVAGGGLALLGPPLLLLVAGPDWAAAAALLPLAGLFVAVTHVTAVLAAWTSAAGGAGTVALIQLGSQALLWPLLLPAAFAWGLPAVLLLRGIAEIVRAALLAAAWQRRSLLQTAFVETV
ncbi:MAG TPA: hypothetical protein VHL31_25200 [Geminicoccus sp.]|uniref:hypothetical protein n=1 Tax=Geminicoccus sp. TaxID=2024832 RepID=UPI002E323275|nr:hypothetical protein [Geminicoccus sp.]HEX2529578.1 hypothetical protein [Geminicoccus sp.]